jgi:hypothetical protein
MLFVIIRYVFLFRNFMTALIFLYVRTQKSKSKKIEKFNKSII